MRSLSRVFVFTFGLQVLGGSVPAEWTKIVNLNVRVNDKDASGKSWDIDYSPGGGIGPLVIFGNGVHPTAPDLIVCLADEAGKSYCFERSTGPNSKPEAYAEDQFNVNLAGVRVPEGYFGVIVFDVDGIDQGPQLIKFVLGAVVSTEPEADYDRVRKIEKGLQRIALQHRVVGLDNPCHRDENGKISCTVSPNMPDQLPVKFIRDIKDCSSRDSLDPVCALPHPSAGVITVIDRGSDSESRRDSFVACGRSMDFEIQASTLNLGVGDTLELSTSGQTDRCGGEGLFHWNFGDGKKIATPKGRVEHVFDRAGEYRVEVMYTCSGDLRTCFVRHEIVVKVGL